MIFRCRHHFKPKNAQERLEHQKLITHIVELMVIERGVKRLVFMFDCQAAGVSNTVSNAYVELLSILLHAIFLIY